MLYSISLLLLLGFTKASPAHWDKNLAYRSPYPNEPGLAIDTQDLHDRHQSEIQLIKRRRQEQEAKPDGEAVTYSMVGYGLGWADWGDAEYVYKGGLNFTHGVASGRSSFLLPFIAFASRHVTLANAPYVF